MLLNDRVVDEREKARLNSLDSEESTRLFEHHSSEGCWSPPPAQGVTVAVMYRLGVRVYTESGPCTAFGEDSDAFPGQACG